MWKKRFGLDKTPYEKLLFLMDDYINWDIDIGNKNIAYHKHYPEFRLEFGEPKKIL